MPEQKNVEVVIYFTNGRMVRLPRDKARFAHMGQAVDEEYTPAIDGGIAVINWDNVAYVREWQQPEEIDP